MIHTVVAEVLDNLREKKVYFEALGGNNGDTLIEMGAKVLLKHHQVNLVDNFNDADIILINGSGDLSYHQSNQPIEETRQASILLKYRDIPVILLPSSCTPGNAEKLKDILRKRIAPTTLIARDEISFGNFRTMESEKVKVFSDHDLAFGLVGSKWLKKVKMNLQNNQLIIVERFDAEGCTTPPAFYTRTARLRSLIPAGIKQQIKKRYLGKMYANTPFVSKSEKMVKEFFPELHYDEVKAADISLPQNYSFEKFVEELAGASVVVSTRLHCCILAALLEKPFIAVQFEGGSKLLGVFEKSLQFFPNAKLQIIRKQ